VFSFQLEKLTMKMKNRFRPSLEALEDRLTPSGGGPDVWSSTGNTDWYTPGNWSQNAVPNTTNGYQAVLNNTSSVKCIWPGTEGGGQARPASLLLDSTFSGTLQVTGERTSRARR
jgi:hypothetical protein